MTPDSNPTIPPNGYLDIVLTSVTLHPNKPRKPPLMADSVERNMQSNKPTRFFGPRFPALDRDGQPQTRFKIAELEPLEELARKTGKQLRILMPPSGRIPIYFSKEAERMADKHQRKKK